MIYLIWIENKKNEVKFFFTKGETDAHYINDGYKPCIRFSKEDIIAQYNVDIDEVNYKELCYLTKEKNNYYVNNLWANAYNKKASRESVIELIYTSNIIKKIKYFLKNG